MMNYFDLLTEPRRPWLDTDRLRQKFLALASEARAEVARLRERAEAAEELARAEKQLRAVEAERDAARNRLVAAGGTP